MMIESWAVLRGLAIATFVGLCATAAIADDSGSGGEPTEVGGATLGRMGEPAAVDPNTVKFSEAESRLWMSDHLHNIARPARLYYQFTRGGSLEEGFSDNVYLDVVQLNADGTKDTNVQFFSGERAQPSSPDNVTNVRGNPVLGVYMRGDVYDMNRLTQGSWRYFQRRIKAALSERAVIEAATITFNGRIVAAKRITITPYANDPHRVQIEQFVAKRYEFLLSEEIPGTIYQIHTVVPGASEEDKPLLEETLTLKSVEFRS